MDDVFDVIIIGGGPAGMSAALWCSNVGLRSILIEKNESLGGQLSQIHNSIDNYLGVSTSNGEEMRQHFIRSLKGAKFDLRLAATVLRADLKKRTVELDDGSSVSGRAVIIATGVRRRKLGVPGEEEFFGKGILSSGAKEADKVAGKRVVIVGGGDAAFENALILSRRALEVALIHRRDRFKARREFVELVERRPNVKLLMDRNVFAFHGRERLESVDIRENDPTRAEVIPCEFALIRIGVVPNTELFRSQIALDNEGYVSAANGCKTSVEDVYAAGDVINRIAPTISTASGDSATAVKQIVQIRDALSRNPKI